MILNDKFFEDLKIDTDQEPFVIGSVKIYKNYIRDGSGRHEGYTIEAPISKTIGTTEDLVRFLESIPGNIDSVWPQMLTELVQNFMYAHPNATVSYEE